MYWIENVVLNCMTGKFGKNQREKRPEINSSLLREQVITGIIEPDARGVNYPQAALSSESPAVIESEMVIMESPASLNEMAVTEPSMYVYRAKKRIIKRSISIKGRRRRIVVTVWRCRIVVAWIAVRVVERYAEADLEIDAAARHCSPRCHEDKSHCHENPLHELHPLLESLFPPL